jgi:colicin import membrane protein
MTVMTGAALSVVPPSADLLGTGALVSLAVHGGLVVALALGVNWRQQAQTEFSAELWSDLPQVAAPPAPAPEPAPPPPPPPAPAPAPPPGPTVAEIALEREKVRQAAEAAAEAARAKAAKDKADRDKAARDTAAKDKADRAAEEARLESQRQQNLQRLLAQAGGSGRPESTGTAARDAAPSNAYAGLLIAHIRSRIVMPDMERLPKSLEAVVEVRSTASGTVLSKKLVKPSGNDAWDEAVLRAIDRAGTLPRDRNGLVPTSIEISFRPQ